MKLYEIWNRTDYLFSPPADCDPFTELDRERKRNPRASLIEIEDGVRTVISCDPVFTPYVEVDEDEEDFDYDEYSD